MERMAKTAIQKRGRCGCKIKVGDVGGYNVEYPLSANGWSSAKKSALAHAKRTGMLALVDLHCGKNYMALYQCHRDDGCVIESVGKPFDENPEPYETHRPIAGHLGRARRRGR
jgi:hypothetical protein